MATCIEDIEFEGGAKAEVDEAGAEAEAEAKAEAKAE